MKPSILLFIVALSISCHGPEMPVDPRDAWIGTYTYQSRYYHGDLTPWTGIGNEGTLQVEKAPPPGRFRLKMGATHQTMFGHSLEPSQSGYSFRIEEQVRNSDSPELITTLSGYANVEMDGIKHQGVMNTSEGRIHYFLKVETVHETYFIEIDATRK